jgi:hypothetical protein
VQLVLLYMCSKFYCICVRSFTLQQTCCWFLRSKIGTNGRLAGYQSTQHTGRQAGTSHENFTSRIFSSLARLGTTVTLASHQYLRLTLQLPKSVNRVRYWNECCRSGVIMTAVKIATMHYLQQWSYCHNRHDVLSIAVVILSRSPWCTIYSSGHIVTIDRTQYL